MESIEKALVECIYDRHKPMDKETGYDILLSILSGRKDGTFIERLEDLSSEAWEFILTESNRHRVSPLVYKYLSFMANDRIIPQRVVGEMRREYLLNSGRNMLLFSVLRNVLAALQGSGIQALALKGAHLADSVYRDRALRPMGDIDLLIRRSDLERSVSLLGDIGFKPAKKFFIEDEISVHRDIPALQNGEGVVLEIHWNIVDPGSPVTINPEELWERAEQKTVDSMDVLVLSLEDLLIHVCIHASFHHRFSSGLLHVCDIAEILSGYGRAIDWGKIRAVAKKWNATRSLCLSLLLTRDLLGAEVPQAVLDECKPDLTDPQLIEWSKELVMKGWLNQVPMTCNVPKIAGAASLAEKYRNLIGALFPPRKVLATKYAVRSDSPLLYCYYLLRLKDIFVRYAHTFLKLLSGERKASEIYGLVSKGNTIYEWLSKP